MSKKILILAALFGLATLAAAQTVADAAQKEKERRVAVKPGAAVVVTNADLAHVRKKSAVKLPDEKAAAAGAGDAEAQPSPGAAPAQNEGVAAVSTGQGADPRTAQVPSSQLEGNPKTVYERRKADLERTWAAAKERIDLLSIKMVGLQQLVSAAALPGERDQARAALVETSKTMQDAQASEKKAKEELDRFASGGKSVSGNR